MESNEESNQLNSVIVNWFSGDFSKSELPESFEWYDTDRIFKVTHVPIIFIKTELYNSIANSDCEVPEEMINYVKDPLFRIESIQDNDKIHSINNSVIFIISDGEESLAIKTEGDKKSKLIPEQEKKVLDKFDESKIVYFNYDSLNCYPEYQEEDYLKEYSLQDKLLQDKDLRQKHSIGLTRREREAKLLLFVCLREITLHASKSEVRYWLTELDPKNKNVKSMSRNSMLHCILNFCMDGWSKEHEYFCDKIVNYYNEFKDQWESVRKSLI